MPMHIVCPGCGKALDRGEQVPGTPLRCSACQRVFETLAEAEPAADAIVLLKEPAAPSATSSPPPLPDEPRPARRRRPARKQSSATALIVAMMLVCLGGLFALVCAGGIGWWLLSAGAVPDNANHVKPIAINVGPRPGQPLPPADVKQPPAPPFVADQPPPVVANAPRADGPMEKERPTVRKTDALPPAPAPLPIKPVALTADVVTKTFPDTIDNVVLGGGGRFLILHLPKQRQLAVFDVNKAEVVKYLPVASDKVMIAAGMTKLILVFPDSKIVQRWDLLTFERERTATVAINDAIAGIGMGYGSAGPLLIQTMREPFTGDGFFLDIDTLQRIDLTAKVIAHVHRGANAQIRGSLDGRSFGVTSGGNYPYLLTIERGGAVIRGGEGGKRVVPGPDGKTVFGMGLYDAELKRLGGTPADTRMWCVPALSGPFYLAIPTVPVPSGVPGVRSVGGVEVRIVGDSRPILTLPDVENAMGDGAEPNRGPLTIDQRYHFIPDAQLLITIPSTADRLVLHKLNLDDALERAGIDYLFVVSTPPPLAVRGQEYTYPVRVRSKRGGLKFRIDAGPDGMTVSAAGTVTWQVPADHAVGPVEAIMTISDSAGQEIFHTFRVQVTAK